MIRPVEDFQNAVQERGLTEWQLRRCSICGYPVAFVFLNGAVGFDPGCNCTRASGIEPRTWEDVADHYNRNQPENNPEISQAWLDAADAVFGFDKADVPA